MPPRDPLAPFRMAVIDKFKDLGTVVMGKSESGAVRKGDTLLLMPNRCLPQFRCRLCGGSLCADNAVMCPYMAFMHHMHMCSAACDGCVE